MTAEETTAGGNVSALSPASDDAPTLSRRDRTRLATMEEIKDAARELLVPSASGGELSLRAVAREIGMTPSAIYRYFESRQDLMEALAHDAFASVASALASTLEAHAGGERVARVVAVCGAYRNWCLEHPAEFALIFRADGSTAPGSPTWSALAVEYYRIPFQLFLSDLAQWELPREGPEPIVRPEALELIRSIAPDVEVTPRLAASLVSVWAAIHGYVCLELFGHLQLMVTDVSAAYERHVKSVLRKLSYRPAHSD